MLDITDRVSTELQLRHTEKLLRSLINASPDFICFKDGQGRWQEANSNGLELFQLDNHHYQGKTDIELAEHTHSNYQDFFNYSHASDSHVWNSRRMLREEETVRMPHGGEKVFDLIKVPLFHDDGSRQGLVTLGRDITERKMAERNLRDRSAVLDALISCDWMLHSSASWQSVATKVLEQLSMSCRFNRATLLKNSDNPEESIRAKRMFSWSSPGLTQLGGEYETIHFELEGCSRWIGILQQGQPIFGGVEDLPKKERKLLRIKPHKNQNL